ncbi:MAG: hypothetical protein ACRDN9_11385 [Streptosporangiaceae bacterium]
MARNMTSYRTVGRTPRDVLIGVTAILALAVLVAGVPFALLTLLGSPLPTSMPSLETLTQPIGVGTLLDILAVLVWLAWIQLIACVVVEVYAGIRGVGMPTQVPLAWGTQTLAHRLVAAALLLFTATGALVPALAGPAHQAAHQAAQQRAPHAITATQGLQQSLPGGLQGEQPQRMPTQAAQATGAHQSVKKYYTVQPPEGRHHESLWEIAQEHLGEGRRYKEIFQLNQGHVQPDGTELTIASLIRPGWVLEMPADAHGPGVEVVRPGQPAHPPSSQGAGSHDSAQGVDGAAAAPVGQLADGTGHGGGGSGGGASGGASGDSDSTSGGTSGGGSGGGSAPVVQAPGEQVHFPNELAAAVLLAAGILAALGGRRRQQLWNRAFGTRIRGPEGEAALAEEALRIGADSESVRFLDLGLRLLSRLVAERGRVLPVVYAAHLGVEGLDLWVVPADHDAPSPWIALDRGQVWRLPRTMAAKLDEHVVGDTLAPYPGLVSLGTNDTGRILVDLEAAHGLVALRGAEPLARAALAAVAVELATNAWSDHMRVTLVGFGDDLTMLAPDRVRAVDRLAEVLPELEAEAEETRGAMAASGIDSVLTGRCRGLAGQRWMPHYVLLAGPPERAEAGRLRALAATAERTATGYVVAGDMPGAAWTWDVGEDGRLRAGVLGLEAKAQLLPDRQYSAVVELFRAASELDGLPLRRSVDSGATSAPGAGLPDLRRPASVDVRILGAAEVDAGGDVEESRRATCTEALVYLAAHPEGVHPTVLGGAIWPRGVTGPVRDATIARVRDWLGRDSTGRPNLDTDRDGRLRLGPEVRLDWAVLRALVQHALGDPAQEQAYLSRALDLVRGPLLEGRPRARYAWLAADPLEYDVYAWVSDAAHRLVELRLDAGDGRGAVEAARAGLRLAVDDELLWRDLLRATAAAGDTAHLRSVVDELRQRVSDDPVSDEMHPETEALVDELLPSWRLSVAN